MSAPIFSLEKLLKIYDFNRAYARKVFANTNATKEEKYRAVLCRYFCDQIDKNVRVD